MALCMNADYACEVTLQPLARYELDAAILFSDILTIPDAMGLGLFLKAVKVHGFVKRLPPRLMSMQFLRLIRSRIWPMS